VTIFGHRCHSGNRLTKPSLKPRQVAMLRQHTDRECNAADTGTGITLLEGMGSDRPAAASGASAIRFVWIAR